MIISYLLILVVGFVLLIKGADFFVEGSSAAAKKFRVPSVVIGLTVVAMGTSAPELAVSLSAALEGSNEIAVSNVTGSNMFNLMAVLGICAVMSPLPSDKNIVKKDYPFMIFITLVLIVLSFGNYFGIALTQGTSSLTKCGILGRFGGIVLLILFAVYIFSTVKHALKIRSESSDDEYEAVADNFIYYRWTCSYSYWWQNGCCGSKKHSSCHWNDRNSCWAYSCCCRNISSGACYIGYSGKKRRKWPCNGKYYRL